MPPSRLMSSAAPCAALALTALAFAGAGPVDAELAGRSLPAYPHFEFVRSINGTDPVLMAVDPSRHPALVGVTAPVYVVAHKDAAAWTVDPALLDARPGGPQVMTFAAGGIQDNTIVLAPPGTLPAGPTPEVMLGIGYDVVIDVDDDGALSSGDLIDGRGDRAGFYLVHDTTAPGPFEVSVVEHDGGGLWLGQRTFYPTGIGAMGRLPLVAIGHGWTHTYQMYDHIGRHLASYGYVVTAFTSDVGGGGPPATHTAALSTLTNTDYIIGAQSTIAGGVLAGHIDSRRITWIGHSTGAEAVVRAYTRLGATYVAQHYTKDDIVLVSSICPVNWLTSGQVDPGHVNYHMFIAGADTDTSGAPIDNYVQSMTIYERSKGNRQLVMVHGAGHNDFHIGDQAPFADGPDLVGKAAVNLVAIGYYLPLVEFYARDNPAAKDFLTRRADVFRPIGIPSEVILSNEYKDADAAGHFAIDDYETNDALDVSSSGGDVTFDFATIVEVLMRDHDGLFTWTGFQASNGMTRSRFADDTPHCAVMDWSPGDVKHYESEIVAAERDLSDDAYLSFRACQGTRHPRTDALDGPLSFTVALRDGAGVTSAISTANYGAVQKPYPRTGFGPGAGWGNEFETFRLRLADFETNASGIDLSDVVAVRFDFGTGFGSPQGRIGLDDVQIIRREPPAAPRLEICLPEGVPTLIPPGRAHVIDVRFVTAGGETHVEGSGRLWFRTGFGAFASAPLEPAGDGLHRALLPPGGCGARVEMWFEAEGTRTGTVREPALAPGIVHVAAFGEMVTALDEPLDADPGWARDGEWAFGVPTGDGGGNGGAPDPESGFTGANVFGVNLAGDYSRVPGPPAHLTLGPVDCTAQHETRLVFRRRLNCDARPWVDVTIDVSTDGATWTNVWRNEPATFAGESILTDAAWALVDLDVSEHLDDASAAYVRWGHDVNTGVPAYSGWNIDDVALRGRRICCPGDVNGDGTVGFADLVAVLASWGACAGICPPDVDGSGAVDLQDVLLVLAAWGVCRQ